MPLLSTLLLSATLCHAGPVPIIDLDRRSPYYPNRHLPALTTPLWVGEDGVDAVVILAVDDMRDHRKYETFLRPILDRLKKIDGRAPVSIMACNIDPATPQLQAWLKEGLSIEVHTADHPCPLLGGKAGASPGARPADAAALVKAKSTYDRCVDQMFAIPGNAPVAFRTPCCDSLNTPSPRVFSEIFNKTTPAGHFLTIDSSVFNVTTANDPALPRELVVDKDGQPRFQKYVPFDSFVNTIEDYPYPYIIGERCWEFPCATPSDWQAQYVHKRNMSPIATADWKAQLDVTVIKQGVFTAVFHPHGWSSADQWVEFIDYAQSRYGKRVKFLTFKEAHDRLTKTVGSPVTAALRTATGGDAGVRVDTNKQRELTFLFPGVDQTRSSVWNPRVRHWIEHGHSPEWRAADKIAGGRQAYFCDIDGDGRSELFVGDDIYEWDWTEWKLLPFRLPVGTSIGAGIALADVDEDGHLDVVFGDGKRSAIFLFQDVTTGWSRKLFDVPAADPAALPPIVRADGTDNGFFVHSRHLWWQNEDTAKLKNLVDRRSFNDLLKDVPPRAKSPAASLASMRVAPGYQVELVAFEPLVQDPIAFSFGPDGKLWVVEMADYPAGVPPLATDPKAQVIRTGKPGGRVKYLEDTNNDGVYDKSTVFLDDVPYPTSVLPWRNGVLVAAAPDILYCEDTDHDGKADKREVLFTGFREGNQQHRLNHLSFGLDNWVYGANGDSGGNVTSTKTKQTVSISGRDFRFKPDTGEFEAVAGQSQFGRSRTDDGDWFGCNNSNPLWHFPLEEQYLKRNPHVPTPANLLRVDVPEQPGATPVFPISRFQSRYNEPHGALHFTSACSSHVYRDDLFPKPADGSFEIFTSEPVHNLLHREWVTRAGSTFKSRRPPHEAASEFLASSDNWFRPTTVATGPDGALYVADMYRAVIEHPQWIPKDVQDKTDLRAGHDMGRIYRISPVGKDRRPIPRLDKLDTAGLVAALDSPSGWQRDLAQRMLIWRGDGSAAPLLEKLRTNVAVARAHALYTLEGLGALGVDALEAAVKDPSPVVARHGLRVAFGHATELGGLSLKSSTAADPAVRLELASALGASAHPNLAAAALGRLAAAPDADRFLIATIVSSLNASNVAAVTENVIASAKSGPPRPELISALLRTAVGTNQPDAITKTLAALTQPKAGRYEPWQFQTLATLLDSLEESKTAPANLLGPDAAKSIDATLAAARKLATDATAPSATRAAALPLLGREEATRVADQAALAKLLSPQSPPDLQAAAIAALARRRDKGTADLLLQNWKTFTPALRVAALDGLLTRADRAAALLDAVESKAVLVIDIDAPRRQRLLQYPDKPVRTRAEKLFAESVNPDRQKVLEKFAAAATLDGDPKKGQRIFNKTCATCHRLGDTGHAVGPDLASVGDKSPAGLLVAILDPNRVVEPRYANYIATTNDDQTHTGLLASESGTAITLIGPEAQQVQLRRRDLKDLRSSNTSLMPEGLEANLSPQDLADLIAHVRK